MKKFLLFLLIVFFSVCTLFADETERRENKDSTIKPEHQAGDVFAQKGTFELGGIMGVPSGLNMRYWFTDSIGIDSSLGASVQKDLYATMDLLYERFELHSSELYRFRFFFGLGALIGREDGSMSTNLRIPLGFSMPFKKYPVNLSLYAAPAFVLSPDRKMDANFGFAVRYNFSTASSLNKKHRILEERFRSTSDELGDTRKYLTSSLEEVENLKGRLGRTETNLRHTKGRLSKTETELSRTKGELLSKADELAKTKSQLESIETELDSTKTSLSKTKTSLDKTKTILSTTEKELVSVKQKFDTAKENLDDVKSRLDSAQKALDERSTELTYKQAELNTLKNIIREGYTGSEKKEEEEKLKKKQEELDRKKLELEEEKQNLLEKVNKQKTLYSALKTRCEARRGILNEEGYCTCRTHEEWNSDRSKCVCVKGYSLNEKTNTCEPCRIIDYYGRCAESGCRSDEKQVRLRKGPHSFVCVKRCRGTNEFWSSKKNKCVCKDGYYRNSSGICVPRR